MEKGPYPEEVITDASYAVGTGYGEGKYVSERILLKSSLHTASFRIGQISGGAPNGAWATSDWFPMIVKSSLDPRMNMLPDARGVISWIPMDAVAEAIIDVGLSSEMAPPAINLVHPHPIPYSQMIRDLREAVVKGKQLDADANASPLSVVPFRTWVEALERVSAEVTEGLPAAKIIDFLRGMAQADEYIRVAQDQNLKNDIDDTEAVGLTPLVTNNIQRISARIADLKPIGAGDVELWVRYWMRAGL
ncbi:hypothetical protein BT96DRAFT_185594, partial [Gymnopus androsaceus JB14]